MASRRNTRDCSVDGCARCEGRPGLHTRPARRRHSSHQAFAWRPLRRVDLGGQLLDWQQTLDFPQKRGGADRFTAHHTRSCQQSKQSFHELPPTTRGGDCILSRNRTQSRTVAGMHTTQVAESLLLNLEPQRVRAVCVEQADVVADSNREMKRQEAQNAQPIQRAEGHIARLRERAAGQLHDFQDAHS